VEQLELCGAFLDLFNTKLTSLRLGAKVEIKKTIKKFTA
jgi:hypothetical protein